MKLYLGIDFGAENIMVFYQLGDASPQFVPFGQGEKYLPNWYVRTASKEELFGWDAKSFYDKTEDPTQFQLYRRYKLFLRYAKADGLEKAGFNEKFSPGDLLAKMLGHVIRHALEYIYQYDPSAPKEAAVVSLTVPVGWTESEARKTYDEAFRSLGLGGEFRLVAEPVAASVSLWQILLAKHGLPFFDLPKTCLLIDIGASTADLSLCSYDGREAIQYLGGNSVDWAGDRCDEQIGTWLRNGAQLDEDEALEEAKSLKHEENLHKVARWVKRLFTIKAEAQEKRELRKIARAMADHVLSAAESLFTEQTGPIDFLVFCGGMSRWTAYGYLENISNGLDERWPDLFADVQTDEKLGIADSTRQYGIARGACLLARNPALIFQYLGYEVRVILRTQNEEETVTVVPSFLKIGQQEYQFSLWNAIRENYPDALIKTEDPREIPLSIFFRDTFYKLCVKMNRPAFQTTVVGDREHFDLSRQKTCDLIFKVDVNGVIRLDLVEAETKNVLSSGICEFAPGISIAC